MDYNYATGVVDNISRLTSISDASGTLEAYSYQGDGTVLQTDRTQPGLTLTKTLDDYGRILDFNWTNGTGSVVRYEYGCDASSNVLYKEDLVNSGLRGSGKILFLLCENLIGAIVHGKIAFRNRVLSELLNSGRVSQTSQRHLPS